jgi:phosphatidate cytidylyltransferase
VSVIWFAPPWATVALAALAATAAAAELAHLSAHLGASVPASFLAVATGVVCVAFACGDARAVDIALLTVVMASAAVTLALGPPGPAALTRAALLFMSPFYIGLPLGALAATHAAGGAAALTWFLALMAVSDSAQYYSGRAFGRHKLAPAVSPAKTVEGAVGGVIASAVAGAALAAWLTRTDPVVGALVGVVLAVLGMVGDLFESMLKRSAGVKDASALIPGHGGVLDRIDSYLIAAPFYYLFVRYFA